MDYSTVKHLHLVLVITSFCGFIFRGLLMFRRSPWFRHPLTRTLPHVLDTLLLASGLALIISFHIYPTEQPWLLVKFAGIAGYILLGKQALNTDSPLTSRALFWTLAIIVFLWTASIAVSKSPFGLVAEIIS